MARSATALDAAGDGGVDESSTGGRPVAADGYRPSARLARLVRARDRRCRFPGCTVAAVFCDLDHVRPWPAGPTDDTNLVCLCRRHHRVKQRPGWHVTLATDGTATWTDPTGRVRTTHPADALTSTVLTGAALPPAAPNAGRSPADAGRNLTDAGRSLTDATRRRADAADGPHSDLEFRLEHRGAPGPGHPRGQAGAHHHWRDDHGRRHRIELIPSSAAVLVDLQGDWPHRRVRRTRRRRDHDPPPF